jgi:hypothetical protein
MAERPNPPLTVGIPLDHVRPRPSDPQHTTYVEMGQLKIGVEYRVLADQGVSDQGVTFHVFTAADGREFLRFDVFDDEPHYHYMDSEMLRNRVVPFDSAASGPMLPWAIACIRERLPEMLEQVSAPRELIASIDVATAARVAEELAVMASERIAATRTP